VEIRPIRTEADYNAALREISVYFEHEPDPGTPEGDRFEIMLTLVEAYEAKRFPIDPPHPMP
jgi:HTH-type transcriptional regulator / antitoxin HigA